jgi:hypothetical protein
MLGIFFITRPFPFPDGLYYSSDFLNIYVLLLAHTAPTTTPPDLDTVPWCMHRWTNPDASEKFLTTQGLERVVPCKVALAELCRCERLDIIRLLLGTTYLAEYYGFWLVINMLLPTFCCAILFPTISVLNIIMFPMWQKSNSEQ